MTKRRVWVLYLRHAELARCKGTSAH